jgi:hypothetical protein
MLAGGVRPPPLDRSVRESGLVANSIQSEAGLMTTRFVIATTAAVLLGCGPASAQVGATSLFPGPALGMTSPLGVGPGSLVPPIRIPMGATELASPGVSPTISGTFPEVGGIATCSGGSASQTLAGMGTSMSGSSMNTGGSTADGSSLFDGGGMSGSASGGCTPSASAGLPGSAMASTPTAAGSVSSVCSVGTPMAPTEMAVGGLSPPSVALAPNPLAPLMTLTPLVVLPNSSPSTPLSTSGSTASTSGSATSCSLTGTGVPSITGVVTPFGSPLSGRALASAELRC